MYTTGHHEQCRYHDTRAHYLSVVIPHTAYTDMTFMFHRIGYPCTLI